eukprot:214138-Chlamydomonas_euryale.AAC.1
MVCTCASRGNKEGKGKRRTTHQPQKGQQAGKMKKGGKKGALTTYKKSEESEPIPNPCARHRTGNAVRSKHRHPRPDVHAIHKQARPAELDLLPLIPR